jgi:hypothetical protein
LPIERGRRDMGSEEGSVREVSPPQVAVSGEGTEKVPLAGGLLETGHEVQGKYKEHFTKHTFNVKILIIFAPLLPPR